MVRWVYTKSMTKTSKPTATQIAYLRYLAGQGERPAGVAIGNIENALRRRDLVTEVVNPNNTRSLVPNEAGRAILDA